MKRSSGLDLGQIKSRLFRSVLIALFFVSPLAFSNAELDRVYGLETIGYLRTWDNVDGLFGDTVSAIYKDYFSTQSRFLVQDLSKADSALSKSKIAYQKLIDDPEILGQVARQLRAETILRTKIQKEGPKYKVVLDWLHSPRMDQISTETFFLADNKDSKPLTLADIREEMQKGLDRMISKIPFKGQVSGRTDETVTINIGLNSNIKKGDELVLATIEEAKKHPLLRAIVDWRMAETGRAVIETVDEGMAFAKVKSEEENRQIAKYQKIIQIIPAAPIIHAMRPPGEMTEDGMIIEEDESPRDIPRLGYLSGGLLLGPFSRTFSSTALATPKEGTGTTFGAKLEGELWFNRSWFSDLSLLFATSGYTAQETTVSTTGATPAATTSTSGTSVGASLGGFKLNLGYIVYGADDLYGNRAHIKLGYKRTSYDLGISTAEYTSPTAFSGLFLGFGGDLPIRDQLGAMLQIDLGLFTGAEETGLGLNSASGASDAGFMIGGFYRSGPKTRFNFGIDFTSSGADFTAVNKVSHKLIAIFGALLFYF